ncbi:hypothetical protein DM867_10840 [Halosegnis rubeus]|uniref:TIGR04206 family protein n=1 Tax=Halosegnis rubeus TaxID=2212850 RepID=A0A5N5U4Y9_9EURY|nr:hypothetical protein [Halosegnis rubeus]KAB7513001.1 hypothetical protein DM867_10840 [Halosegnis rubeus]
MSWVEPEHAGELAVVSAWLATLLPWSVSFATDEGVSLITVRFPVAMFQFLFGADLNVDLFVPVWAASGLEQSNAALQTAYYVWLAGAIVVGVAFLFSLAYYGREETVERRFPASPVRVMGGLLTVAGGCLAVSAVRIFQTAPGVTVPVGAVLVPLLGVTLLGTHTRPSEQG